MRILIRVRLGGSPVLSEYLEDIQQDHPREDDLYNS